jgi:TRAP-type C4-dicarboxylate transport system permease small subunit
MAKRKGSPKSKKARAPITKRDQSAKKVRRAKREADSGSAEAAEKEPTDAEADAEADADAEDDAASSEAADDAPEAGDADAAEAGDKDCGDDGNDGAGNDGAGDDGNDDDGDDEPDAVADADLPAWAAKLRRFEKKWTWFETRLMFAALMALTCVLCFWIGVRGMSESLEAEEAAGTVFRGLVGAGILGGIARALTRGRLEERRRNQITVAAVIIGLLTAKLWRGVGIDYFHGLLAWLQEGSTLALFGGLKGVSTRLTMLVALLGASLAAASGTHINIDVVVRFIPKGLRRNVAIAGSTATAIVCLLASYGFLDFIAVTGFKAEASAPMSAKVGKIGDGLGEQFFIWRKQAWLDLSAAPHVLAGGRYDDDSRMNGHEWNTFIDEGGFVERYGAEKVETIKAPAAALDAPRVPFVAIPGGNPRGMMVHAMDLVFPLGFFMIALRVLLRALLVIGGAASVAPHGEEPTIEEATS